jgi:hypothetical protein
MSACGQEGESCVQYEAILPSELALDGLEALLPGWRFVLPLRSALLVCRNVEAYIHVHATAPQKQEMFSFF